MNKLLSNIDVEKSECGEKEDHDNIFSLIQGIDGGFSYFNKLIRTKIREWFIQVIEAQFKDFIKICQENENKLFIDDIIKKEYEMKKGKYQKTLGILYHDQGRYEDSENLYREYLENCRRQYGDNHSETLNTITNLALVKFKQKKYEESKLLYKKSLAIKKVEFGEKHPNTLKTMFNLGVIDEIQGNYEQSKLLLKKCFELRKDLLGENHPDTIETMSHLALVYNQIGEYKGSKDLLHNCLKFYQSVFINNTNHPFILKNKKQLAECYINLKEYGKSEEIYCELFLIYTSKYGENNIKTLKIMNKLGFVYQQLKKTKECEELYKKCITLGQENFKDNYEEVLLSIKYLAFLYLEKEYYNKTINLLKEYLKISKMMCGEIYDDTLISVMETLSKIYIMQKKFGKVKKLVDKILFIKKALYGEDNIKTMQTIHNQAMIFCELNNFKGIILLEKRLRETIESSNESSDNYETKYYLSLLLSSLGKYAENEELFKECRMKSLEKSEENPSRIFISTINLAKSYLFNEKYPECEEIVKECLKFSNHLLLSHGS